MIVEVVKATQKGGFVVLCKCEECNKEFERFYRLAKRNKHQFCSGKCMGIWYTKNLSGSNSHAFGNTNNLGKHHSKETKEKISQTLKLSGKHGRFPKGNTFGKEFGKPFEKGHTINIGRKHPEEQNKKQSISMLRENHPNWRGGRLIDRDGYVLVLRPEHPSANNMRYVREHRIVMEDFIGRYLLPIEVVHHINGIKDDNRIENLMLFENNIEHKKYHSQTKKQEVA